MACLILGTPPVSQYRDKVNRRIILYVPVCVPKTSYCTFHFLLFHQKTVFLGGGRGGVELVLMCEDRGAPLSWHMCRLADQTVSPRRLLVLHCANTPESTIPKPMPANTAHKATPTLQHRMSSRFFFLFFSHQPTVS